MELVHIGLQLRVCETIDDLAMFDDVVAVRDGGREAEILFDEKDRESLVLERAGQPERGLRIDRGGEAGALGRRAGDRAAASSTRTMCSPRKRIAARASGAKIP